MKQGYNARLDESLGARNGRNSQSMKSRRDESKGMSKKMYGQTSPALVKSMVGLHALREPSDMF